MINIFSNERTHLKLQATKVVDYVAYFFIANIFMTKMVFADEVVTSGAASVLMPLVENIISIAAFIFVVVGIIVTLAGVGQLVTSFLNEDGDSKARAAKTVAVGAFCIVMPLLISALNLTQYLT